MEYHVFIGIDRSDSKLDIAVLEQDAKQPAHEVISSKPEAMQEWVNRLQTKYKGRPIAVCIEQPCVGILHFLSRFEFITLFPINP